MNEHLKNYKNIFEETASAFNLAKKMFLEKAFENRTEYALPMWIQQDNRDAGELHDAWCWYRHDGAFIGIGKVEVRKDMYFVSGYEDMEYSSDYMQTVQTYDTDAVAAFVLDWINDDMDNRLASLAKELSGLTEEDEDVILSKVEPLLSGGSDPNISEILAWAKEFTPFNE